MSVCLYLPDGRVAFMFRRPEITTNDAIDAGGLRIEVVEPFRRCADRIDGKICLLERPFEMADPRRAFRENPWTPCKIELDYRGLQPDARRRARERRRRARRDDPEKAFARAHYEQHVAAKGRYGRRRGVGDRRLRPARQVVGPPVLAGAVVVPVADRQLRRARRVRRVDRDAGAAASRWSAACGWRTASTSRSSRSRSTPSGAPTTTTTSTSAPRSRPRRAPTSSRVACCR